MNESKKSSKDGRGGARIGAGRKPNTEDNKILEYINEALVRIYGTVDSDEAKVKLLQQFGATAKGREWLVNKLFGKPTDHQIIEQTSDITTRTVNLSDLITFKKPEEK